jgi:hypothetical protein
MTQAIGTMPVKASRHASSRTITATEVRAWFGKSRKSRLGDAQYREIAAYLTKIRWPTDVDGLLGPQPPTDKLESNDYWDFDAAFAAAKLLLESMPAMLRHWNGLLWAPETRGGHPAIKILQDALSIALPYIEWPFGRYERQTGRKQPKVWHLPAVMVARVVVKAMIDAGHDDPGITRHSIVVRVVCKALIRMQYPHVHMITASAVGAHLTRRDKKYGLTPKGIAALTTK